MYQKYEFQNYRVHHFEFIQGDILKTSLDFLKSDQYRVVGNLP